MSKNGDGFRMLDRIRKLESFADSVAKRLRIEDQRLNEEIKKEMAEIEDKLREATYEQIKEVIEGRFARVKSDINDLWPRLNKLTMREQESRSQQDATAALLSAHRLSTSSDIASLSNIASEQGGEIAALKAELAKERRLQFWRYVALVSCLLALETVVLVSLVR